MRLHRLRASAFGPFAGTIELDGPAQVVVSAVYRSPARSARKARSSATQASGEVESERTNQSKWAPSPLAAMPSCMA